MFTASSAPVTSRCRPRWSTIFCFRGPLRRSPRVCLRFFGPCFFLSACGPFGAARGAFFFRRVPLFLALPGPFSPSGPSLASRRPSGSASLASHLPADAGAFLRSSALRPRVLSRSALRRFACLSRRAAARRPLSSCLCFSPARRRRRRRTLALRPGPFAAVPAARSLPSSLPFQPPLAAFFLAFVSPAFAFVLPVAFGDPYSCLCFCLAFFRWAILMVVFWISFSFYCFGCVYRTVGEKGRVSNREKAKGKGMVRRGGRVW